MEPSEEEKALDLDEIPADQAEAVEVPRPTAPKKANAFDTLMKAAATKTKLGPAPAASLPPVNPSRPFSGAYYGRNGLGAYMAAPELFPKEVLYSNDRFVAIWDMYPKSSLHALLLPKRQDRMLLHPFRAFQDVEFLEDVRQEVEKLQQLLASELKRKFGRDSAKERRRREAIEAGLSSPPKGDQTETSAEPRPQKNGETEAYQELPPGRDWASELIVGVHAGPSMAHLHIHVLSRDRHSECIRHRKHYNSFATGFLVPLADMPLAKDDPRWTSRQKIEYLQADFKCWRCGKNFGKSFKALKEHLEVEYEDWRKE